MSDGHTGNPYPHPREAREFAAKELELAWTQTPVAIWSYLEKRAAALRAQKDEQ